VKSVEELQRQYEQLRSTLDERSRRRWAASEALALGRGGIALVHTATGMVPSTIGKGIRELKARESGAPEQAGIRRQGGGRKKADEKDPSLLPDLEKLVEPVTRGDPESPLRWVAKSLRRLSRELRESGHDVSRNVVSRLLKKLGYSLQANAKTTEGSSQHEDRNAQFEHINRRVATQLQEGNPAISVDTKKKELVGDYRNGGREYRPTGNPEKVQVHDFVNPDLGKASPYGIYDIGENTGWVNVGITADTAEFAVESIRRWWNGEGCARYPRATEILITADGGGSNGYRVRLWKVELQRLADDLGLPISVCHLPPGTSKWNKIEHRLFSFISKNWRGQSLVSHQTIVKLISATRTDQGLTVKCELDENTYEKGRKVSDDEMAALKLWRDPFHGEWNYTLLPTRPRRSIRVRRAINRLVL
jgi:transposase